MFLLLHIIILLHNCQSAQALIFQEAATGGDSANSIYCVLCTLQYIDYSYCRVYILEAVTEDSCLSVTVCILRALIRFGSYNFGLVHCYAVQFYDLWKCNLLNNNAPIFSCFMSTKSLNILQMPVKKYESDTVASFLYRSDSADVLFDTRLYCVVKL